MAAKSNDVPSVPVPPTGSVVPPVEPTPAVPVPPVVPAPAAAAPAVPRVDPYAAPGAAVTPPPGYSVPGAGYAPAPAYGAPGSYAAAPANGLSIASMITGIVGVLCSFFALGLLPAVAAVITGHIAQKRQPYAKPFWLTGLITGYVGLGISILTGLVALLFFIAAVGSASYFG